MAVPVAVGGAAVRAVIVRLRRPVLRVRVRPRGRVNGDRISGTYRVQVWDAATGAVLQSGTGRFWGTRIEA